MVTDEFDWDKINVLEESGVAVDRYVTHYFEEDTTEVKVTFTFVKKRGERNYELVRLQQG